MYRRNYFLKYYNISGIAVEKYGLKPPFDIYHPFEDERDEYEQKQLLDNINESFDDYSKTLIFDNINNNDCFNYIADLEPEIIITFGTGLIKKPLIGKIIINNFSIKYNTQKLSTDSST